MDPNSGTFHPVEGGIIDQIAKEVQSKPSSRPMLPQAPRLMRHPGDAELVFAANKKRVPKDWPIFAVGETYEIAGVPCEIAQITAKDIHLRGEVDGIERGARCELQGREFRVRFTFGHFVVVRPVIGKVVST